MPEYDLLTDPEVDVYWTETPIGTAKAIFKADDEDGSGVRFDVLDAIVGDWIRDWISEQTGLDGIGLDPDTITGETYYGFCQPKGSGVVIQRPAYLELTQDEQDEADKALLDDTGGARPSMISALRGEITQASGALAKLAAARRLLAAVSAPADTAPESRRPTAHLYSHDEKRSKGKRQKANDAAIALLRRVQSGELSREALTEDDKRTLAGYSGNGGSLVAADGVTTGSDYEYYTPAPIAAGAWDLLKELGFSGGKVLDPCSATGIFGAMAPANTLVDAVELSPESGAINALLNEGPGYKVDIAPFERIAAATEDEQYDAVVTNVPFSRDVDARGGNQFEDDRYQKEPIENYFILRSLEKLRPGGLAAFITPPRCVSGRDAKQMKLRREASLKAEFLGAYRLPNSVFGAADADTITDLIVFRKFSRDAARKVGELLEQSPATLGEVNVLWSPFLEGKYFTGEGKRFILGEFVPKDPTKFRDVDRVKNPASIADVAKLMRKFPGSRIDWGALEATETQPIEYQEGDTLYQAGQCFVLNDGAWVARESGSDHRAAEELLGQLDTAMHALINRRPVADGERVMAYLRTTSRTQEMPDWLRRTLADMQGMPEDKREGLWRIAVTAFAVSEALEAHQGEVGFNYATAYPELTAAMRQRRASAQSARGKFAQVKPAVAKLLAHARAQGELSPLWRGETQAAVVAMPETVAGKLDAIRYQQKSPWLPLDQVLDALGADNQTDLMTDPAWCLSGDGRLVQRADDYYTGNVQDLLVRLDAEIEAAANTRVRDKLLAQKAEALNRIPKVDPKKISYNLFSPYVTDDEKLEFLRKFVHPKFEYEEQDSGKVSFKIKVSNSELTDEIKLLRRVGQYVKEGTITLGSAEVSMSDAKALAYIKEQAAIADAQFAVWARSNPKIQQRISDAVNNPKHQRFRAPDDTSPLSIPGLNPEIPLHGYQNAFVRSMGRDFSGINGFGVGLGKTFTALAAVQHVQAMGVKEKTLFVVPASVLSNWHKEAKALYTSMDDCLFVGLRQDKKNPERFRRVASAVDEDLNDVLANQHRKIFMTFEAFEKIRLREETVDGYLDYLGGVESAYDNQTGKAGKDERAKSKQAKLKKQLTKTAGGAPYLEEMGVDSIVFDEMHCFPAGTLVDGVPIEQIKAGDSVHSFNHESGLVERRRVTDVMRRRPDGLVRVHLTSGQSIVCTPDHPFYVPSIGYVQAQFLNTCYTVVVNNADTGKTDAVQPVRGDVRAELLPKKEGTEEPAGSGLLLKFMRIEGEQEQGESSARGSEVRLLQEPVHAVTKSSMETQAWGERVLLPPVRDERAYKENANFCELCGVQSAVRAKSYSELEGDNGQVGPVLLQQVVLDSLETQALGFTEGCAIKPGKERKNPSGFAAAQLVADAGSNREKPASAHSPSGASWKENQESGWERGWFDGATNQACESAWLGNGVCCENGDAESKRVSEPLQDRYCEPGDEGRNRGGWRVSQCTRSNPVGQAEGRALALVRVDRVEVLESSCDGRFGGLCPDGYVYDITVDGNHNFFAEGVLVHNCHKNAAQIDKFKGAKYLSTSDPSGRGLDAMAKCWYVRNGSAAGDGVLGLTATPITNSPLEIYSMLSLAVGQERMNQSFFGIDGADDFMEAVCLKSQEETITIEGKTKMQTVFTGLSNLEMLRNAVHDVATIEDAESVGKDIVVPERDAHQEAVALDDTSLRLLDQYRLAYAAAKEIVKAEEQERAPEITDEESAALDAVMALTDEPVELIAHPFNLINKMTLLIADPELSERATFYTIDPDQRALADKAIAQLNKLTIKEEREKRSPHTPDDLVSQKVKGKGDDKQVVDVVLVSARMLSDTRLVLDTMDPDAQLKFEKIADKLGLDLNVTVPPKLAAMLANVQKEQANPRGLDDDGKPSPIVKQLIFCDILPMMTKIKRTLVKHAGLSPGQIEIITGKVNGSPSDIIDVQNRFNAHGEDNEVRAIIANKKAEVGINLQRGTQAIHHLTIGWTPDSIEQRNGRGARQGNKTVKVAIYHYDAEGTFDGAKRHLVGVKASWIDDLMGNDAGSVNIKGGMSREEIDALISASGQGEAAMTQIQGQIDAKNREMRIKDVRLRQSVAIRNIEVMKKELAGLTDDKRIDQVLARYANQLQQTHNAREALAKLQADPDNAKPSSLELAKRRLSGHEDKLSAMGKRMDAALILSGEETATQAFDAVRTQYPYPNSAAWARDVRARVTGLKADSAIGLELQDERDAAQGMLDGSIDSIQELSGEEGAYPADAGERIASGQAALIGTQLFAIGALARGPSNGLWMVRSVSTNWRQQSTIAFVRAPSEGSYPDAQSADSATEIARYELLMPGSPEYEDTLDAFAAWEDAQQAAGQMTYASTFSSLNAEVAKRRTSKAVAAYDIATTRLPAPYFPVVLTDDLIGTSDTLKALAEQQKAIVQGFETDRYRRAPSAFYAEVGANLQEADRDYDGLTLNRLAFDQCVANGEPFDLLQPSWARVDGESVVTALMQSRDWSNLVGFIQRQPEPQSMDEVKQIRETVQGGADVILDRWFSERARRFADVVISKSMPATVEMAERGPGVTALCEAYLAKVRGALNAEQARQQAEREAAEREAEAQRQAEAAKLEEQRGQWVVMKSDFGLTKVVNIRKFASDMGEPAAWKDKYGRYKGNDAVTGRNRPDAPNNSWTIPRAVFEALQEQYPSACVTHHVKEV